jgi:hypothetical protein
MTWAIAAEAIGCSPSNLMAVANRKAKSREVAKALATLIGHDVKVVFPDIQSYSKPEPKALRAAAVEAARQRLRDASPPALNAKSA